VNSLAWGLTIGLPLLSAIIVGLLSGRISNQVAAWIANLLVGSALVVFLFLLFQYFSGLIPKGATYLFQWFGPPELGVGFGFVVDDLSFALSGVVLLVSAAVHLYSVGYMAGDPGFNRFLAYISLFTFSMLCLVWSPSFLQLFFGWELVGLVSYLLIGFWHQRETAVFANFKAFIVNRIGDFGFIVAIALIFANVGTLDLSLALDKLQLTGWLPELLLGLIFMAVAGKSAQMPLHVWLPDSMEGPTPISALIHAATMVTAGVYLLFRIGPLFEDAVYVGSFIVLIGAVTAMTMAAAACLQYDIKRIIAYSTLSHLGFMVAACGVLAFNAAFFHLVTHAFFKALLFLAAGAVIVAMHHEQDIRSMGGLWKRMPVTFLAFAVAYFAAVGVPGGSGFFSKDLIVVSVQHGGSVVSGIAYALLVLTVFFSAYYMTRLFARVFFGKPESGCAQQAREVGWVMTVPLLVLAAGALIAGPIWFDFFVNQVSALWQGDVVDEDRHTETIGHLLVHALTSLPLFLTLAGIAAALLMRRHDARLVNQLAFIRDGYGFDDLNNRVLAPGYVRLAQFSAIQVDRGLVDRWLVMSWARATLAVAQSLMASLPVRLNATLVFGAVLGVLFMWITVL